MRPETHNRASFFRAMCRTGIFALMILQPASIWACAACFGQSDAPMARAFNWGILSLLCIVGCVLGGIATFFIYLARRSASLAAANAAGQTTHQPGPSIVH